MATLHGGPANGLTIADTEPDVAWVAADLDPNGKPVPILDRSCDPPQALVLPTDLNQATEMLLDRRNRTWQCYRKIGARIPDLGPFDPRSELPIPSGGPAYRWVDRRFQA